MGRQAGVFARQDAALVGDVLAQHVHVLGVERVDGEVDLGTGARCAALGSRRMNMSKSDHCV